MHSNNQTPAPGPAIATEASTPPVALRFVRSLLWIGLGVMLVLLVALAVVAACLGGGIATAIVTVLVAAGLTYSIRRLPANPWIRLGAGYAALLVALAYLASDDPSIRRPLTLEDVSPRFAGAERSHDVLMRYGKAHPLGRDFQFKTSAALYRGPGVWKPKDPQWSTWLTTNRAELESNWQHLEPVRAWWAELNTFDQIGDLTPPRFDAEMIAFAPIRYLSQHACAIASLQALDGNGDAAMETLLPLLEVSRKLEPASRTLVRFMIARTAQKLALETAAFVLDHATLSPEMRARFARALIGGCAGEAGARYVVGIEYAWGNVAVNEPHFAQMIFAGDRKNWVRDWMNPLKPIVLNSRRTLNLYGDLTAKMQDLAAHRAAAHLDDPYRELVAHQGRATFKNLGGTLLLTCMVPSYQKIVDSYWATEDLRAALHARLQT